MMFRQPRLTLSFGACKQVVVVFLEMADWFIRPDGKKKAYVRLTADHDALDVANKVRTIVGCRHGFGY